MHLSLLLRSSLPLLLLALTTACSNSGGPGINDKCAEALAPAASSEFCAADAIETDCALVGSLHKHQVCGVALKDPAAELQRSSSVDEHAGSGAPDIGCFAPDRYPPAPGTSDPVPVYGVVKTFSTGPNSCPGTPLTIEIYTVKRSGGDDDGDVDQLVGTPLTVSTSASCGGDGEPYSYPDVPKETELVVKTSGDLWATVYEYGVFIRGEATRHHNIRPIAQSDYLEISQRALGRRIAPTYGAILGEVHDCGNVRLLNAIADIDAPRKALVYFDQNEEHPLPDVDPSVRGTSSLGLYAAVDVPSGPAAVAAAGLAGGEVVTLGFLRARVFADSITNVTFRGLLPFQVP